MKTLKKKIVSCALAAAMVVPGTIQMIAPLNASASVITPIPGSAFQYEVITQELSTSGNKSYIKLTIRFVNNPGINTFGIDVIVGDGSTITSVEEPENAEFTSGLLWKSKRAHFAFMCGTSPADTNYEFSAYITVSDVSNYNQITVQMYEYNCSAENISCSIFSEDDDVVIPVTSSEQMVLGDTNNNNRIEQVDAYKTLCAVNNYSGKLSVNYLRTVKNTGTWKNLLPQLKFAEAMDVNFDGYITEDDSEAILMYNSYQSLGTPDTSSPIGKVYYVNL